MSAALDGLTALTRLAHKTFGKEGAEVFPTAKRAMARFNELRSGGEKPTMQVWTLRSPSWVCKAAVVIRAFEAGGRP